MGRRPRHSRANHIRTAEQLRAQPGRWLLVGTYRSADVARSFEWRVRTGRLSYGPPGAYEARTQPVALETAVYARYMADAEEASAP